MTHPTIRRSLIGFIGWLIASFVTGGLGAIASVNAVSFYGSLTQPSWAPPAWLFGPVWTTLFVLMGISAWLVWREHDFSSASVALKLYLTQLIANALWSWLFFTWHLGVISILEIIALWVLISATILSFWKLNKVAALLLIPYLAWVSFAAALNVTLWRLNPIALG
jgi:tryptophan-rich sensory protein